MKTEDPARSRRLILIGAAVILLVAVAIVVINWEGILDWLVPAGRGK